MQSVNSDEGVLYVIDWRIFEYMQGLYKDS